MSMQITPFFDPASFTYSYVVSDPATRRCAIIDAVLDYDPAAGRTTSVSAERIVAYVREQGLGVDWLLETHVHADHLSAAAYLKAQLGGRLAIGAQIIQVQASFAKLFNTG
ncbi:MAG TPA: MBL fold metallo-hydrolase, partial [Pseudomonas sp.]|nr:MBL fold metallo-hydrolase [Pseudomonas sp.]